MFFYFCLYFLIYRESCNLWIIFKKINSIFPMLQCFLYQDDPFSIFAAMTKENPIHLSLSRAFPNSENRVFASTKRCKISRFISSMTRFRNHMVPLMHVLYVLSI